MYDHDINYLGGWEGANPINQKFTPLRRNVFFEETTLLGGNNKLYIDTYSNKISQSESNECTNTHISRFNFLKPDECVKSNTQLVKCSICGGISEINSKALNAYCIYCLRIDTQTRNTGNAQTNNPLRPAQYNPLREDKGEMSNKHNKQKGVAETA